MVLRPLLAASFAVAALTLAPGASADPRPPAPKHCSGHVSSAPIAVTDVYANQFVTCEGALHWSHAYVAHADCHRPGHPYCVIGNYEWSCHTVLHRDHTRTVTCGEIGTGKHGEIKLYWHRR